jgi:hypothetical protein
MVESGIPQWSFDPTLADGPEKRRLWWAEQLAQPLTGLELGGYDRVILRWLAGWDTSLRVTLVSLLYRARAAGAAGERTRLAGLLDTMLRRQAEAWQDPDPAQRAYLQALQAASELVAAGGEGGITVQVGPQPAPTEDGAPG